MIDRTSCLFTIVFITVFSAYSGTAFSHKGQNHAAQDDSGQDHAKLLGTITFPTSGAEEAQKEFITGVLALHNFWYPVARDHFRKAQKLDPSFAMAYWGEAMTHDNPSLAGAVPGIEEEAGLAVIKKISELDLKDKLKMSERERGYVNAIRTRFTQDLNINARRRLYAEAMGQLAKQYPDDDEAIVFDSLALMAHPDFDFNQPSHVVTVSATLEEIFQRNHNHPGVLHYLIHVYDTPTFALMGLRAARIYAKIAPASSHAQHMISHIFRQLGMWEEVITANIAAYQASVEWQQSSDRPLNMRDYHAFDWLLDAYLTLGRFDKAEGLMDELDAIESEMELRSEDPGIEYTTQAEGFRIAYKRTIAGNQ